MFTFALGTAAGDLTSEKLSLGYWVALGLFAGAAAVVCAARFGLKANAVASFWAAYVLTRPLGASLGDLLSQPKDAGGLGIGTTLTSGVFLAAILALVGYLAVSKTEAATSRDCGTGRPPRGLSQKSRREHGISGSGYPLCRSRKCAAALEYADDAAHQILRSYVESRLVPVQRPLPALPSHCP